MNDRNTVDAEYGDVPGCFAKKYSCKNPAFLLYYKYSIEWFDGYVCE